MAYEIVQVVGPVESSGDPVSVTAPGEPVAVPGLSATITLTDPSHLVQIEYSLPAQTDTAGAGVYAQVMRGGVALGLPQPLYSSGTVIASLADTVNDSPGYVGPLVYEVFLAPIEGTGHAPANFGGAGWITVNEVNPSA